jgi:hypothetical protein
VNSDCVYAVDNTGQLAVHVTCDIQQNIWQNVFLKPSFKISTSVTATEYCVTGYADLSMVMREGVACYAASPQVSTVGLSVFFLG